ncbi:MAG: cytochrome c peroxidase [Pirellulaceae bacterium]
MKEIVQGEYRAGVVRLRWRSARKLALGLAAYLYLLPFYFCLPLAAAEPESAALAPLPQSIPAPGDNPTTDAKVRLGRQLFFDPRLSGDNTMSCAHCHLPEKALADGEKTSAGAGDRRLKRNTPSVLNTAFLSPLTWDGRAKSLEEQALGPITSPVEMHQDLDELERELAEVPGYVRQFRDVFDQPPARGAIAKALAAFQRTLVSRRSPLDRYLEGEKDALSASAKHGMELFTGDAGCIRCHHGPLLSDGKFYRLGVSFRDEGRGAVTGKPDDAYKFRTPPLRDVARTAPYMHDGSLKTLAQVVEFYFRGASTSPPHGLSLDIQPQTDLSYSDIEDLTAFLRALSGEPPSVQRPELP